MIISQTPYRISLAGGGTDLPAFYQEEFGAVVSVTLSRHMYVTVHDRFEKSIRVAYSRTETVKNPAELQHELVREAMRVTGIRDPLEITTIGDVPGGTGMGSSSVLAVGLLNALHAYRHQFVSRDQLAEESCRIELELLGNPIGKQDQYAAAFGGLNYMRFNSDDTVNVDPIPCHPETLTELEHRILLFYTEQRHSANDILTQQSAGTNDCRAHLRRMRDLAGEMRRALTGSGNLDVAAEILHTGWELKRSLGFGITNPQIDHWYTTARSAGATAGKLLGAGGGGFLLLMAPPERHEAIRDALGRPRELPTSIDRLGSRIVFISDSR